MAGFSASSSAAPAATGRPAPSACRSHVAVRAARLGRASDQRSYTRAQIRNIERRLHTRLETRSRERSSGRVGLTFRIPVRVHVIDGRRSRGPSRKRVLRQLNVLNKAYSGSQSRNNTATPFAFYLDSFDRVTNPRWETSSTGSPAQAAMRRALHVGGPEDLNLYFSRPADSQAKGVVLGWSSMAWDATRYPRQDGVTIHQGSLPGGSLAHYNRGDTTVHEVGHWLGLLHTFEGGCSGSNDLVDDTPAEAAPSSTCDISKNTCTAPGLDPVHNFMDYAVDSCMNMFTPGQVTRMTDNWLAYRTP
jgi:hypothetical protein